MKKATGFVIVLAMVLASLGASAVSAAPTPSATPASSAGEYAIPEMNMKVHMPEGWTVFTRDVKDNDPNLSVIGIDAQSLKTVFEQNGVYLDAFQTQPAFAEITIIMHNESKVYDLNSLSDEEFEDWIKNDAPDTLGYTTNDYAVYRHKQARFVSIYVQQDINGTPAYGKQYFTIVNGQGIGVNLFSYSGAVLTAGQEAALKSVVDGIAFTAVRDKPSDLPGYLACGAALALTLVAAGIVLYRRKRHN